MDAVDRIFDLLDKTTMDQCEFAKLVGVSDDTASDWRRRRSGSYSRPKYIAKIAEVLGTTTEYLLTGKKETAPVVDPSVLDILVALGLTTPEAMADVIKFQRLTSDERRHIIAEVEKILSGRE